MSEQIHFLKSEVHPKAWGREIWIVNNEKYCGKILQFNKDSKFSMHYHLKKTETWYVTKGRFMLTYFDLQKAKKIEDIIEVGFTVHVPVGQPHQLLALQDSEVFEISTTHFEEDSYRIEPGDSQK
jgi:mannose-6-phosphate isomerase-like protein (cupin superfamily)